MVLTRLPARVVALRMWLFARINGDEGVAVPGPLVDASRFREVYAHPAADGRSRGAALSDLFWYWLSPGAEVHQEHLEPGPRYDEVARTTRRMLALPADRVADLVARHAADALAGLDRARRVRLRDLAMPLWAGVFAEIVFGAPCSRRDPGPDRGQRRRRRHRPQVHGPAPHGPAPPADPPPGGPPRRGGPRPAGRPDAPGAGPLPAGHVLQHGGGADVGGHGPRADGPGRPSRAAGRAWPPHRTTTSCSAGWWTRRCGSTRCSASPTGSRPPTSRSTAPRCRPGRSCASATRRSTAPATTSPDRFDPGRWERCSSRDANFIPFGVAGNRPCPAWHLAPDRPAGGRPRGPGAGHAVPRRRRTRGRCPTGARAWSSPAVQARRPARRWRPSGSRTGPRTPGAASSSWCWGPTWCGTPAARPCAAGTSPGRAAR